MEAVTINNEIKKPLLADLVKASLYVGATAYGGLAMTAQLKKKFVEEKKWISEKDFLDALSFAQILPGATFVTLMAYVGYRINKIIGAFIVPFFFILPTFATIVILSYGYFHFAGIPYVVKVFAGLGAMVVALLINAVSTVGKSVFPKLSFKYYKGFLIAAFVFVFSFWFKIGMIYLIIAAGVLGFLFYYFTGEFEGLEEHKQTELNVKKSTSSLSVNLLKYGLLIAIIVAAISILSFFPLLGEIFTSFFKIGMFSFGGYSSLPLMQHESINVHHWLSLKEFSDGIAMGQITPGPILITAAFIGFKVAGIIGAAIATTAIFSPSILLIILLYELHGKITKLPVVKVFVKGILAGFIGLLIYITVSLGVVSLINWQTWVIFVLSAIALIRFKIDPLWIILSTIVLSLIIL